MLKLVFNIKCGYEDLYLSENNAEFPLDILCDEQLYASTQSLNPDNPPFKSEDELFAKYVSDPTQLIRDYTLFPFIRGVVSYDYLVTFFLKVAKDKHVQFFPELFVISEVRLERYERTVNKDELKDETVIKHQKATINKKPGCKKNKTNFVDHANMDAWPEDYEDDFVDADDEGYTEWLENTSGDDEIDFWTDDVLEDDEFADDEQRNKKPLKTKDPKKMN